MSEHSSIPSPTEFQQTMIRMLARATDRAGLSTAYGHCSSRLDSDHFLVCASKPMGLIKPREDGTVVPLGGPLPHGVLGEVRVHREIYRQRPDVQSIVRFISPSVTALAALGRVPRPRHGVGAFFAPEVPFWPHLALVRNDEAAAGVAQALGQASAIVLSVNGAVVVGADCAQALALGVFLEDAARVELIALGSGLVDHPGLPAAEARACAVWAGNVAERLWSYWTDRDPERKSCEWPEPAQA